MGSECAKLNEDTYFEGYEDRLELDREMYADLENTLKGIRRYAHSARPHLDNLGKSYIGNNLVTLSEQALDTLKRIEVVSEEHASSLTDADMVDMYERRRDEYHR